MLFIGEVAAISTRSRIPDSSLFNRGGYEFGCESSLTLTSLVVNLVYGVVKQEIFTDFP